MGSNTSNYRYDPIGNRRMAEEVYVQAALVSSYAANSLDQFTGITPDPSTIYHLAYDGNGNVTDLVGTNGSFVAKYQYDPYGNTIGKSGDLADVNHFRFSTKYTDSESGLVYYGFRFYVPEVGRWSGRDPIGESGGFLLYGFCANYALSFVDSFGLWFEWTPLWGTIESYVRTQLGRYPGMKSSDYASCSDEDATICKVKIAQEEYKYWLKFSAPNVVKLGVDYVVTIISIYFKIPGRVNLFL